MVVFEIIIGLLLGGAALTALSRRIGAPYPALLALAGALLAFVPGTPMLVLDPELALALFVAPVLLDAAFDTSLRDLRTHWRSVVSLVVGAVGLTVLVVAVVVHALVPDMPWSVAVALGAIVAPPDAAAASAVLGQLRPPQRLRVVLEGESLFNDASALLVYRLAVGVTSAGAISPLRAVPTVLLVTLGSVVLGLVLSRALFLFIGRIRDVGLAVIVQFCGTFAVWLIAEALHLSGILTVVAYAMATSPLAARETPAGVRVPSFAVWESVIFVLNVLAFVLVGFQLKGILRRLDPATLGAYAGIAAAVCAATMGARFAYVAATTSFQAIQRRLTNGGENALEPRSAVVVAWSGMRGVVTLAAALALPTGDGERSGYPYRDLIVLCSYAVVLTTLVVQGMTLGPLIRALRLRDDGSVEHEVRRGRIETARAALKVVAGLPRNEIVDLLRRRYDLTIARAEAADAPENDHVRIAVSDQRATDFVQAATGAEREKLLALRDAGTIGAEAFQQIEEELDREELYLERITGSTGSSS